MPKERSSTGLEAGDVYRQLAPAVLAYLRASRTQEPEDLLGEVFLQVARDLPRFKGTPDDVRPWVFRIARNRMIDAGRRRQRRRGEQLTADVPDSTTAELPESGTDAEVVAALGALTDEQREVVTLRFVADLSLEQVAAMTGRTVGAVKAMQHRALEALAKSLG